MRNITNYFKASYAELRRVVWPDRRSGIRLTITVIIFSAVLATIIGSLDFLWRSILAKLILR